MNRTLMEAWRGLEWTILAAGTSPAYREAIALLESGLAGFGLRAKARAAGADAPNDAPAIILNSSDHGSAGYAIRLGVDRMEFYGDSEAALPFAAAAFLEALGSKAVSPGREIPATARLEDGRDRLTLRSAPSFAKRTLVLREAPPPGEMPLWKSWARRRGFDSLSLPESEFRLSEAAAAEEGGDGIAVMDMDARDSAAAALSLIAARSSHSGGSLPGLLSRSCGTAAFIDAFLGEWKEGTAVPALIVDDGDRCRAHAIGDPGCGRNALIFGPILSQALSRWKRAGGELRLRLRYDDDWLFPAPCPPQASLIAGDLAWAAANGFTALEYVASSRLPERPSLNAWVFSALAFPPPREGSVRESGSAALEGFETASRSARGEFFESLAADGKSGPDGSDLSECYSLLEESWAAAFDRGIGEGTAREPESLAPLEPVRAGAKELLAEIPPSPADPWDEDLPRQEERAAAMTEAYGKLDRCAELAGTFAQSERAFISAHEASIEMSGAMRALYAEAKREGGAPSGIAMIADGAALALERRLKALFHPRPLPRAARRFLLTAYRFRIAELSRRNARGPMARLRASIFRVVLFVSYGRLSH